VTSIVDLNDGRNIVSGSYDKKINIYDYRRSETILSLDENNSAVACMTLTGDNSKIVSSGLDSSISVWKIFRRVTI
jgi:WD40 repeat protein